MKPSAVATPSARRRVGLVSVLLAVFLPLVVGPLVTVAFLLYQQVRADLAEQTVEQLTGYALIKENQIDQWANQRLADLTTLSQAPDIVNDASLLSRSTSGIISESARQRLQARIDGFINANSDYRALLLINTQTADAVLVNKGYSAVGARNFNNHPVMSRAQFRSVVLPPAFDARFDNNFITVVAAAPVIDSQRGTIFILAGVLRDTALMNIVAPLPGLGQSARAYLLNEAGQRLGSPIREAALPNTSQAMQVALGNKAKGRGEYLNYANQNVFGSYTWLPRYEVGLIIEQNVDESLAPLERVAFTFTFFTLLAALTAGVVVVVVARQLVRPIGALTETAQELAAGNLNTRATSSGPAEVDMLAEAFNRMSTQLRESYQTLEDKVAERTRQLQAAADVGRAAVSTLDAEELLARAVVLIHDKFGYEPVSIFLIDETGQFAVLSEITGVAGAQLKNDGYRIPVGSNSIIGWVTANSEPRISSDVQADPLYLSHERLANTRAEAAIPLRLGQKVIGALDVQSPNPQAFSPSDVEALQVLADQLAVALQNSRLFTETQTTATRLRTLSALALELTGPEFGTADVPERIARRAVRALGADGAGVWLAGHKGLLELKASVGLGNMAAVHLRVTAPEGVVQQCFQNNQLQRLNDANGHAANLGDQAGGMVYSVLAVPLLIQSDVVGVLLFTRTRAGRFFSADDETLAQLFAAAAAAAYDNTRLLEDSQQRIGELATINRISQLLSAQLDIDQILQRIGQAIRETFSHYKSIYISIGLYDQRTNAITFPYYVDPQGQPIAWQAVPLGRGLSSVVLQTRNYLLINEDPIEKARALGAVVSGAPARSWLGVPIVQAEHAMGLITLQSETEEGLFSDAEARLLSTIASNTGAAIQNARLYAETQRRAQQLLTAAEVSRAANTITNTDDLIVQAAELVRERFNLYYVAVFLADEKREWANLRYATGEAGRVLMERKHRLQIGGNSMIGWAVANNQARIADDVADEAVRYVNPLLPETRSEMALPLRVGEQAIGAVSIQSTLHFAFAEPDVAILQTMADQVAIAIRNSQLIANLRTAQQATLENARRVEAVNRVMTAVNATLDLKAGLTAAAREIVIAFDALNSGVALLNPPRTGLNVMADFSFNPDMGSAVGMTIPLADNPSSQRVIETRQTLVIEEAQSNPLTATIHPLLQARGVQTLMLVPLLVRGDVIGTLGIDTQQEGRVFSADEVELAETIAAQIAAAIDNARLYESAQRSAQQLLAGAEISRATISVLDPNELVTRAAELIRARFGLYYVAVFLVDDERRWAILRYATGEAGRELMARQHRLEVGGKSMIGWAVANRRARIAEDVGEESTRYVNPLLPETRSEMALPLVVGDVALGALSVQSSRRYAFSENDITILQTMADQLAIAISNAQLYESTQRELTERQRAEQALNRERALLRTMIDNLPDYIFVKDAAGRFVLNNLAHLRTFGTERQEDVLGKTNYNYFPPDRAEIYESEERALMDSRVAQFNHEEHVIEADGTEHWYLATKVPLYDEWGNPQGFVGISRDVTSLKSNERQVRRQNERLLAAAEVSRATISILDPNELVTTAVDLIRERFDLYYVALFLVDESFEWANLRYATGEAGRALMARKHRLQIGGNSMIGWTVANRQPRIADDVTEEDVRYVNPLLPETRSEMALPLLIGETVLGALSVQSTQHYAFTDTDVAILQTMADQIAIALQNARSYQTVQRQRFNDAALARITQAVSGHVEASDVLDTLARELRATFSANRVHVFMWVPNDRAFVARAVQVDMADSATRWGVQLGDVIPADARHDLTTVLQNRQTMLRTLVTLNNNVPVEALCAPLTYAREVQGVVEMVHTGGIDDSDQTLFQSAINAANAALQIARLYAEQRATAERLAELDRLKSQFLANMSHELRTPLNSIIGFSRVLLKGIDGPINETQTEDLTSIYNSGQHLLRLINDILDMAKIEAGKMELVFEDLKIADLVKSVMSAAHGLVKDKPVRLFADIPADLPTVPADNIRLKQIMLNLLSNAAKFTDEGEIEVRARLTEGVHRATHEPVPCVLVSVRDTGAGIPLEGQAKLFEAFSQVDGSATRKVGGTGLGLSICRQLVELHGGTLWVESTGVPGEGTTFHFTLPTRRPEPGAPADPVVPASQEPEPPIQPGQPTVMVIDDDPGLATLYRRYIEPHGYRLVIINRSSEALARATELRPSAILLDVIMPEPDGWKVLTDLKHHEATRHIPVVMCTIATDRERAQNLGAADYLNKPFLESDLVRVLSKVTSSQR